MTQRELSLFDYAISIINGLKNQGKPLPLSTETIYQYLKIDRRKLMTAKTIGKNPHLHTFEGKNYEIYFSHNERNTDYWLAYEKY
ncbi:MAG: hypothetical protein AAFR77_09030 [Cyanobacteria bacterium J06631_2]